MADITVSSDDSDNCTVSDYLHPEWGNLRLFSNHAVAAEAGPGEMVADTNFIATGPSARAVRFTMGTTRMWGMGLLPLGWAKFVGVPAGDLANAVLDGNKHPAMASFAPLAASLFRAEPDDPGELARIIDHFRTRLAEPMVDEARILAIHAALVDPDIVTVAQLVACSGASPRTVERVCFRDFGFPPKLLLRRQRFMRSLSQFMLDPALKWIRAIDSQYHDQAQFVRDFHQFMGMTPRQYAAMPHPILDVFVRERMRLAGSAVQALDNPRGGSRAPQRGTGQAAAF
ncbi:MAG: helix-turn-helix domain-containing protein [Pseudomonadota bacterium]|nr:helix-turn-helix domain-containing protein [Pseudomonadota bacterium]